MPYKAGPKGEGKLDSCLAISFQVNELRTTFSVCAGTSENSVDQTNKQRVELATVGMRLSKVHLVKQKQEPDLVSSVGESRIVGKPQESESRVGGEMNITDSARERLLPILAEHPGSGLRVSLDGFG